MDDKADPRPPREGGRAVFRVFHCLRCDHHMRFEGRSCGFCGAPKALWQLPWVLPLGIIGLVIVGLRTLL